MSTTDTKPRGAAARPLSPHLDIYRPTWTMVMSIVHRITGGALYVGTALLAIWLIAAASGVGAFASVQWFAGSIVGKLILFGYTWALLHHMLGGVRHLVWDMGAGFERDRRFAMAKANLYGSVALTVFVWVVYYIVR